MSSSHAGEQAVVPSSESEETQILQCVEDDEAWAPSVAPVAGVQQPHRTPLATHTAGGDVQGVGGARNPRVKGVRDRGRARWTVLQGDNSGIPVAIQGSGGGERGIIG
jgi:hypothetical protein